jgi:hypothetical protein
VLDGDRPSQRPIHGQRSAAGLYGLHCVDTVPCFQWNRGKDILLMDEHELLVDLGENPWYEDIVTLLDDDDVELLRKENDND